MAESLSLKCEVVLPVKLAHPYPTPSEIFNPKTKARLNKSFDYKLHPETKMDSILQLALLIEQKRNNFSKT